MAKSFRLTYIPNDSHTRPPKPQWLLNCEATQRSQVSTAYWTKIYWATPSWLDREQVKQMRVIYLAAGANHVDHIVPLKHPLVCGLHVPWNLQVLTAKENLAKSNNWWPNCPKHLCPFRNANEELFEPLPPYQMRLL